MIIKYGMATRRNSPRGRRPCARQGKKVHAFANDTRPVLQGARLTSRELKQAGIQVTLICDNAAASVFASGRVHCVVVSADRIAANGAVANKVATYGVAVLAVEHGVPFYVAAPGTTFDHSIRSGAGIPIEEFAAEESPRDSESGRR